MSDRWLAGNNSNTRNKAYNVEQGNCLQSIFRWKANLYNTCFSCHASIRKVIHFVIKRISKMTEKLSKIQVVVI